MTYFGNSVPKIYMTQEITNQFSFVYTIVKSLYILSNLQSQVCRGLTVSILGLWYKNLAPEKPAENLMLQFRFGNKILATNLCRLNFDKHEIIECFADS